MTRSRTSSLHETFDSTSSSAAGSSATSSSGSSIGAAISSVSTSSPKWTPWNRFPASPSITPGPLISNETSSRSPFSTIGIVQVMCVPPSPDSDAISQSSRLSLFPRINQSLISNFSGIMSLRITSFNAVSPSLEKRIKTSCRPLPPIFCVVFPKEKSRRL